MKYLKAFPYIVIIGLLGFIFVTRSCDYPSRSTKTVEVDSTSTISHDSTDVHWSWLFQQPDTVYRDIPIPIPVKEEETDSATIRTYRPTYRDSVIHAEWTLRVAGELLEQDFQYTPQLTRTRLKTITHWKTRTNTITKRITVTKQPKGYLTAGAIVGLWPDRAMLGPAVGWTSSRGDHLEVGYDALNQGVVVSGKIRISFKRLLSL